MDSRPISESTNRRRDLPEFTSQIPAISICSQAQFLGAQRDCIKAHVSRLRGANPSQEPPTRVMAGETFDVKGYYKQHAPAAQAAQATAGAPAATTTTIASTNQPQHVATGNGGATTAGQGSNAVATNGGSSAT